MVRLNNNVILYVNDNTRDAGMFIRVLGMYGFDNEVVVARNGIEALEFLFGEGRYAGRDIWVVPRLILLDLHMPVMDGLETLWRIRQDERTRRLPVVVFSGTAFPEDVMAAYDLGANAVIDRLSGAVPYPELVRQTAHFWLELNEPPPLAVSERAER